MTENRVSLAELKDTEDTVYAIGLSHTASEAVGKWLHGPGFEEVWEDAFDHADYIIVPGTFDGILQIEGKSVEEVKEALDLTDDESQEE